MSDKPPKQRPQTFFGFLAALACLIALVWVFGLGVRSLFHTEPRPATPAEVRGLVTRAAALHYEAAAKINDALSAAGEDVTEHERCLIEREESRTR